MFALILVLCYNMSGKTNTHIGWNGRQVRFSGRSLLMLMEAKQN